MVQIDTSIDELDRRLVALLRSDSRQPITSLAHELHISRATVKARLERLEEKGIILGYTVRLAEIGDQGIQAITAIKVEGRAATRLLSTLQGFPEITALHATNGRWDIVAQLTVRELPWLEDTLRAIRMLAGVIETETNILLSRKK